jgi:bifunctional DNA-binding transcriptional regulator/antitoxin component of YhaV-PrlF toxin-antitoxin module
MGLLANGLRMWHKIHMNATLSLDEAGRLVLPNTALRVLGIKPGDQVRADVSPNRIDICPEPPVMAQGVIESGVLVMARKGIRMDAAAAVRADRDSLAERALPR